MTDKAKKSTKLAVVKDKKEVSVQKLSAAKSPEEMISMAIEKNVSVETMERLLEMMKEVNAIRSKAAFTKDMANLQKEMPTVKKTEGVFAKAGDTTARYKFAPLDMIVPQVKQTIADNNFIYSFQTKDDGKMLTNTCKVTHIDGHTEENSFAVPIGSESYMSEVQKYGARDTFAKRYAFQNAFGIVVEGEDRDAVQDSVQGNQKTAPKQTAAAPKPAPTPTKPTQEQYDRLGAEMRRTGATKQKLEPQLGKQLIDLSYTAVEQLIGQLQKMPDRKSNTMAPPTEKVTIIDPDTGMPIQDAQIG